MALEDAALITKIIPILNEFKEAEKSIKSAETCESQISLTAVNQIRYAFNHLSSAINSYKNSDFAAADVDFLKSLGHCRRSFYDACDAEITFCVERVNQFIKDCHAKGLQVNEIIPDYASKKVLILSAQKFLKEDQYDIEDKSNRYKQARTIRDDVRKLIFDFLPGYNEVANEKLVQQSKLRKEYEDSVSSANQSLRYTKLAVVVAVIAIAVTVMVVVFDGELKSLRSSATNQSRPP